MDTLKKIAFAIIIVFQCAALCAEPVRVGTTFSPVQCGYFDMDSERTYLDVLDMGFGIVRLAAYWDRIEKQQGVYDFSGLDWQIEEAGKKRIPVVLVVGMKAPRWPEYYIPEWVRREARLSPGGAVTRSNILREATLKFIEKVVTRYKDNPAVKYWQVENEALDRIGPESWHIGKHFLKEEVELVRRLDDTRPIVLTVATYPNKFLGMLARMKVSHDPIKENLALCDILGMNVYPTLGQKEFGFSFYFSASRSDMKAYFTRLIKKIRDAGKVPWVTELQAEPWEPGHLVYPEKEEPRTGSREESVAVFKQMKSLGIDTFLLWGAEYWLFRQMRYGDRRWTDTVKKIIKDAR